MGFASSGGSAGSALALASAGSFIAEAASRNGLTTSSGSGKTTVEFCVEPISVSVCR